MRKTFLTLGLLALIVVNMPVWASVTRPGAFEKRIELLLRAPITEERPIHERPRGPVYVPEVGQTDHTLFFPDETDLFLNLYSEDEDGELLLEYSTAVPAATQSITLPASLTGTFVIEVIRADQHFQGEIEL